MTSAAIFLLKQAQAAGVCVATDGKQLKLRAKKPPSPQLIEALKANKGELLALLTAPPSASDGFRAARSPVLLDEVAARITVWLDAIDRLPSSGMPTASRLAQLVEAFWLGPWARPAIDAGWTDSDLFGLDRGLIPVMYRRTLHFLHVGEDAARLMTGRGDVELYPRPNNGDPPWWDDPRLWPRGPHSGKASPSCREG
jgi:hypothetical protein